MQYNAPYEDIPYAKAAYVMSSDNPVPMPPPTTSPKLKSSHAPLSEQQINRLTDQGFTRSLAESLNQTKQAFALCIWVIDNSGSMQAADGHRFIGNINNRGGGGKLKMVDCSRWDEICDSVENHIRLASLLDAPTRFRFLNAPSVNIGPGKFTIAEDSTVRPEDEVRNAVNLVRKVRPGGCTPLTQHIMEIHREIEALTPQLRKTGQRVSITIATDGLPTDERGYGGELYQNEFVDSLRLLEGLPVWVVIRLCTDDEGVVDFYNRLDEILELSIDVLDDFLGEAKEVYGENPWLTYSLPLHRIREMGYHDRLFDLIDERRLTTSEIRDFCILLFGSDTFDGAPDPSSDWKGFVKVLDRALKTTETQWNPVKHKAKPLVSVKRLNRFYGRSSCF